MATDAWGHSWGGPFTRWIRWGAAEQVTLPQFGEPFLDRQTLMRTTLGLTTGIQTAIGLAAEIDPQLERNAIFASTRISRSVKP